MLTDIEDIGYRTLAATGLPIQDILGKILSVMVCDYTLLCIAVHGAGRRFRDARIGGGRVFIFKRHYEN